jgi:hypothetical protein
MRTTPLDDEIRKLKSTVPWSSKQATIDRLHNIDSVISGKRASEREKQKSNVL